LHLNIRTEQAMRWLQMEQWDACAGDPVDLEDYRERACWAGLDLGATRDLTAFVMCFAEPDGTLTLVPVFWIPRGTAITREKRDRVPYLTWINQGWIRGTDGDTMDQAVVRRDINLLHEDYGIEFNVIAVDRLFQGDQLAQELKEKDGFEVQAHGQGFLSMAAPTLRFGECVKSKRLHHGGNPVLRWHASNAAVKPDEAGNIKPDRKRSTEKIDGIVAAIMAVGQSAGDKTKPVYGLEDFAAFDPETGAITSFQA
jgi:phage terminase large subunit-like protein